MGTVHNEVNLRSVRCWATKDLGWGCAAQSEWLCLLNYCLGVCCGVLLRRSLWLKATLSRFLFVFFLLRVPQYCCSYCQSSNPNCPSLMFCVYVEVRLLIPTNVTQEAHGLFIDCTYKCAPREDPHSYYPFA